MFNIYAGIFLAQNHDEPFNWAIMAPFPIQINANCDGPFEILMGSLENLIDLRILNMHLRAKLIIDLISLCMGTAKINPLYSNGFFLQV